MDVVIGIIGIAFRFVSNKQGAGVVIRVALLTLGGALGALPILAALVRRRHGVLRQVERSGSFHTGAALLDPLLLDLGMIVLAPPVLEPMRHVLRRHVDGTADLAALI